MTSGGLARLFQHLAARAWLLKPRRILFVVNHFDMVKFVPKISLCFFILVVISDVQATNFTIDLFLKDPNPTKPDEKITDTIPLPMDKTYYFIGFEPSIPIEVGHHLIVTGCEQYYEEAGIYRCSKRSPDSTYFYAWARGAPALYLPPGIGFKFGKGTDIIALRVQIHFKDISQITEVDMSRLGLRAIYTDEVQPKEAGVFLLKAGGYINPHTTEEFDIACRVEEDVKLHAFAYRTHSHQLGKVMSAYGVYPTSSGLLEWNLIGKKDPLLPQFFYFSDQEVLIQKGDIMAAKCTMHNFKDDVVHTGSTDDDEMCNYYIMYWVDDGVFPSSSSCSSYGPPKYYWEYDPMLNNIPTDADKLKKKRTIG